MFPQLNCVKWTLIELSLTLYSFWICLNIVSLSVNSVVGVLVNQYKILWSDRLIWTYLGSWGPFFLPLHWNIYRSGCGNLQCLQKLKWKYLLIKVHILNNFGPIVKDISIKSIFAIFGMSTHTMAQQNQGFWWVMGQPIVQGVSGGY